MLSTIHAICDLKQYANMSASAMARSEIDAESEVTESVEEKKTNTQRSWKRAEGKNPFIERSSTQHRGYYPPNDRSTQCLHIYYVSAVNACVSNLYGIFDIQMGKANGFANVVKSLLMCLSKYNVRRIVYICTRATLAQTLAHTHTRTPKQLFNSTFFALFSCALCFVSMLCGALHPIYTLTDTTPIDIEHNFVIFLQPTGGISGKQPETCMQRKRDSQKTNTKRLRVDGVWCVCVRGRMIQQR